MKSNNPRIQSGKAALPLREVPQSNDFSDGQLEILGIFLASLLANGQAVYCTGLHAGTAIRVRIYSNGDTYEDVLHPRDDLAELLFGYAKQFAAGETFKALYAAQAARRAQANSGSVTSADPTPDTGKGGSKTLRRS